jgi:hypothetical protein
MSYDLVVKRPNYLWIVRDFHSFVQIEITNNKSHNIIGQNWGFNPTQKNDCQKYIDAYKNCLEVEAAAIAKGADESSLERIILRE